MKERIVAELDDLKDKAGMKTWRFLLFKQGGPKKALLELLRVYKIFTAKEEA